MKNWLQKYVTHNLGLKIVSLLLAVGLWLAISQDPVAQVAVDVPIEMRNLPAGLEISSEHIPQVQVRLSGPERIIHHLLPSDVHAHIDLIHAQAGDRSFELSANDVHFPNGLQVEQIIPSSLHLNFDSRATRTVQIKPRVVGNFASGYEIGHILVVPPTLNVIGPKKRLEQMDDAVTDPVDVTGATDRMTFATHVSVADPLIQIVNPDQVHVTIIMQKKTATDGGN